MSEWISVEYKQKEKDGEYYVKYNPCFFGKILVKATLNGIDTFNKKCGWENRLSQTVMYWKPITEFSD